MGKLVIGWCALPVTRGVFICMLCCMLGIAWQHQTATVSTIACHAAAVSIVSGCTLMGTAVCTRRAITPSDSSALPC
jgi:hypothetical protein